MSTIEALVLGFVQGISEWLPISSTAHLWIVADLLRWRDPGAGFTAVIQLGTMLAAIVYFWRDILAILFPSSAAAAQAKYAHVDRHLLWPIVIGTIPVSVIGLALHHQIENQFRTLPVIIFSVIFFALLLWLAERRHVARRQMGSVSTMDGLLVGIGQAFALIPGASRSGTTITAALAIGLERETAARFSFLLSLPAVFLSGMYELMKSRHEIAQSHLFGPMVIATIVSFIVGLASIDWLMKYLKRHPTYIFIVYRLVLGIVMIALAYGGLMH